MSEFELKNTFRIPGKARFRFRCQRCGECCRHVRESVVLESLDAFRITKRLREVDRSIQTIEDLLERYADPILLDECGYMMYVLKVKGEDDSCVFLEQNRCTVHSFNPRACRIYPFIAGSTEGGGIEYLVSKEKQHHFIGQKIQVKTWMKTRLSDEDMLFLKLDTAYARPIAHLLRKIPDRDKARACVLFLYYKYAAFDLEQDFNEQYEHNLKTLVCELDKMAD